ncbi:MAG: aminotransferase class V-fold PLP-dependent enzyme [Candidatus Brocadiae bacterium]|nr:aminotransferase class V-fold PLP-dependent enzyme [Candidatus Brocadiia bacterium]
MADPLLKWRREFPILADSVYMISNSLGAMPRGVYAELKEFADLWATKGVLAWDEWVPMVRSTADMVGAIVNAPPGTMIMHQNVSVLQHVLISCFDFRGRRNGVVYSDLEFPTVHYNWKAREADGARVTIVKSPDGVHLPTELMLDAIDERTLVVPISYVLFRSAYIQDAKAIIRRAHQVGAVVVLDAYQAVGTIPVDVQDLDVDFMVGGSVKWLCGGPGAGYLYVRKDLVRKYRPKSCGWFSHRKPFAFDMGPIDYADDVMRFMGGSPGVPALYSARAGYRIIRRVGVKAIRARSQRMTARIVERAQELGLTVNTPLDPALRAGTVSVDFPGAEKACEGLIRQKFIVDYRPKAGIRISPHFYNTDDEIEAIMDAIARLRRRRR